MPTGGGPRTQTTAKSLRLVEELSRRGPSRITDLATDLSMGKSTVHNHLNTLRDCGYVVKDGTKYRLGMKFLELGGVTRLRMDLYRSAQPKMEQLAADTNEAVILATEESGEGVILSHNGPMPSDSPWYTGKRFPLFGTPEGETILAYLPDEHIEAIVGGRAGQDRREVEGRLETVRERGYSVSIASHRGEVRRVATAICKGDGDVLGSLCLVERHDADMVHSEEEAVKLVKSAARRIELTINQPRFGSENVITPKHSLSAYSAHAHRDVDEDGT